MTVACGYCGKKGDRAEFVWMSHLNFCPACVGYLRRQGWLAKTVDERGNETYSPTESGLTQFPGLEIVSACPRDGMPIYRRWVEAGYCQTGRVSILRRER